MPLKTTLDPVTIEPDDSDGFGSDLGHGSRRREEIIDRLSADPVDQVGSGFHPRQRLLPASSMQ